MKNSIYDFVVTDLKGDPHDLSQYQGKAILIVNTASKCGFTVQYDGLQALWEEFKDQGLVILGFPCNQFKQQESGSADEIQEFCRLNFGVTFPLMAKIDVNGDNQAEIYAWLKQKAPGILTPDIKWNFTKFLISPDGVTIKRFSPTSTPATIRPWVQKVLGIGS
ncbi:glutathione peroxidase [Gleimia sp. 6138-11-ORH1]|uniref:glutathione peroxidase n=1 Tax=Gleimia sp. 6138-11-ORH1 TaxID=2973937 RepID=UPI00216992F3|nr:glutathione peroxidase [Gleimia sp. 6138-11-ORH1]MCS4484774.1 glutathione peroxidase [Gleimia sp. 6138-11-ORH1]